MKKAEVISSIATKAGIGKKEASNALNALLETLEEGLAAGKSISFIGFGTFSTAKRAARKARVPGTDRTVDVPATTAVKFKVGKKLKDAVAK